MLEQETQINHRLENQLIIDCSQTEITSQKANEITDVLQQSLDWIYILETAQRNCVLPLVSWNLLRKFDELLELEVKNTLDEYFQNHTRNNMFLTAKLIEVINLLKLHSIPVLPFKGPLLAMEFYGNIAFRLFGDLDILVQMEHLPTAIKLLEQNGYEATESINWLKKNNLDIINHDVKLTHKENKVVLELHWRLSCSYFDVPLNINLLWEDLETTSFAGMKVNKLPFNDLLIYLCVHGGRHRWERLSWICDLNEMISSKEDIDWGQINKEAKQLGCEKAVGLGLHLINKFFGRDTLLLEWQRNKNSEIFEELTQEVHERLFNNKSDSIEINSRAWFLKRQLFHLKLKRRLWDKIKLHVYYNDYYLKEIFSPNDADVNLLKLPHILSPLYYVIRPIRLFYTYVIQFKKSKNTKN
jgi:hypothetical protein